MHSSAISCKFITFSCFFSRFWSINGYFQAHLLEIPHNEGVRSFHINRADCIGADNTITHRTVDGEIVTDTFLTSDPEKDVVMGVTSGASTRKLLHIDTGSTPHSFDTGLNFQYPFKQ